MNKLYKIVEFLLDNGVGEIDYISSKVFDVVSIAVSEMNLEVKLSNNNLLVKPKTDSQLEDEKKLIYNTAFKVSRRNSEQLKESYNIIHSYALGLEMASDAYGEISDIIRANLNKVDLDKYILSGILSSAYHAFNSLLNECIKRMEYIYIEPIAPEFDDEVIEAAVGKVKMKLNLAIDGLKRGKTKQDLVKILKNISNTNKYKKNKLDEDSAIV